MLSIIDCLATITSFLWKGAFLLVLFDVFLLVHFDLRDVNRSYWLRDPKFVA